ncbi:DinB family protein [Deinococcus yavapaiensis]|uniref:Putative damage-inducible protein DinB n=1 Tax=Deinococcus yavapaiensis KR-236 TaxID=694435 RepID=A0A318S5V3_9DEIO|nr:DinB family protein [Deinococcus yavapaiensis]PYE49919.1 putative damage-inducible protein DinB [Deinococcus yavapaiensis KR-236]
MPYAVEDYVQMFRRHRDALVDLLERLPDESGDTTFWEGGMSITQLVDHLYSTSVGVVDLLSGRPWGKQSPSPSLNAAVARLRDHTPVVVEALSSLSDDDLQSERTVFGGARWPTYQLIDFHREHEVHHKGQLWLMARAVEVEPPFFVRMP